MNRGMLSPLWRFLAALADTAVIGALTAVGCLGVVTAPAALAAGIEASDEEVPATMARRFWIEFRSASRVGMIYGAFSTVAAAVAAADLLIISNTPDALVRVVGVTAGSLLLLILCGVGPYAALVIKTKTLTFQQGLRTLLALIVLAPSGLVQAISLASLIAGALLLFPLAAIVVLGLYVRLGVQLELRIQRRLTVEPIPAAAPLCERTN